MTEPEYLSRPNCHTGGSWVYPNPKYVKPTPLIIRIICSRWTGVAMTAILIGLIYWWGK